MIYRICIICEGFEEKEYLEKLKSKNIFHNKYEIIPINARGINNIFARYQDKFNQDSYNLVLIYCDTDDGYVELKENINLMFNNKEISNKIIFFANPCTMQIMLSHFGQVSLNSANKARNKTIIQELTGISNYNGNEEKRNQLMSLIKKSNYITMKNNLQKLSNDDKVKPSTNFIELINNLENEDNSWIINIINLIEESTKNDY